MMNRFYNYIDYWNLYHKVTFDPIRKLILINPGENHIYIGRDIYSASKEWLQINENSQFLPPMRTIGGDPTTGGNFAGTIYFAINGWRILLERTVNLYGAIFSDDFESPYITANMTSLAFSQVSNLVDRVTTSPVAPLEDIAGAVWNEPVTRVQQVGSMGRLVKDTEQKVDDTQALIFAATSKK